GQAALGEPVRVLLDGTPGKAAAKRWNWVRKGAPVIVEVGPRDMAEGKLAMLRRDRLWNAANRKPAFEFLTRDEFAARAAGDLEAIQQGYFDEARQRRDANVARGLASLDD